MHSRTAATLRELEESDWFANVGKQDTNAAQVLPDWGSAIASCGSDRWENLSLEAANQYRARLFERNPVKAGKWNEIVNLVKPAAVALVREKTSAVIADDALPRIFRDTVEWDILHLCMESEFSDLYQPGFYAPQGY